MEVKKIWRVQFVIAWAMLLVLLVGGGFVLSTGKFVPGCVMIIAGMVIEVVSGILLWRNYRCPKCGLSLNRRMFSGGADVAGMVKCPHCSAMLQEV